MNYKKLEKNTRRAYNYYIESRVARKDVSLSTMNGNIFDMLGVV